MRTLLLLFTFMAGIICPSFAQTSTGKIKGLVADNKQQPMANASVFLQKAKDSSIVRSAITDKEGHFEFAAITAGNYFVKTSAMGFAESNSEKFELKDGETKSLAGMSLQAASKELQGVVVTAKKPVIEVHADKTIFNVESTITAQGSDALELLQKTPGVQVDNNENISMKGKTGVRIYVDGKMMQLSSTELAAYLKSINSNDIEAIEMISNPSAKYDASGNAGIINIRLKKNKKYGTNGSVNLGYVQGITPKGNGSVNLNYRDKKINIFGNVGGNLGMRENNMELYRIQNDTIYDQKTTNTNHNKSMNAKVGADFFASKTSTFGVLATINFNDGDWGSESKTPIYDEKSGQLSRTLVARNSIPGKRTNANFNANYRYADTTGRELNVDVDYGFFNGEGRSTQPNLYLNPDGSFNELNVYGNYTPTTIDIFTVKADMEQPAWKGKLGYGGKLSFVTTDNTFEFYNYVGTTPIQDLTKSNSFRYKENVNAAYVNYNRKLNEKWSVQAGLRLEQTNSDGLLTRADGKEQDDDRVKRNYLDYFPSGAITWNFNKTNTLNLTYSRRIDRPTYQELNPFENKLDEMTYQKGNAFLQPQYTDNVELTHTFKGFLNTSVGYSYVKDYSTQVTDTTNGNATYIQERNLASQQIINFSIGAPLNFVKWWGGYANVWYNYQIFDGQFDNGHINTKIPMYGVYLQNSFTLNKKGTKAELSGWFNGPSIWGGTWKTKPMGSVDIGFLQPILKNKASIKVSATDIFFTSYWRAVSDYGGLYIKGQGKNESRTFRVSFNWRFGSNEVKAARQRKTGLESEANRIKS
ncbi:MAG TPA: TonB-dependent receptor [Phnomibacter sp.]|nr:TonB-dependent receptor [Phnomibacter sp.]